MTAKKDAKARSTFGIKPGSRKEEVAFALKTKGVDYAVEKAKELDIKNSTVKSWIGFWRRNGDWKDASKAPVQKRLASKAQDASQSAVEQHVN